MKKLPLKKRLAELSTISHLVPSIHSFPEQLRISIGDTHVIATHGYNRRTDGCSYRFNIVGQGEMTILKTIRIISEELQSLPQETEVINDHKWIVRWESNYKWPHRSVYERRANST